jgi:hypothetical protein
MSIKKILSVTSRQQLIDLNEETTNFDLTFTAKSLDNSHFDVLVVDQTTLDNNPKLEFKRAKGVISGNIISDNNVYQNYFLCLKAEKQCDVEILINKKEIQPRPKQPIKPVFNSAPKHHPTSHPTSHPTPPPINSPSKENKTNWKLIFLVIIILGASGAAYYIYNKKKKEKITIQNPNVIPILSPSPLLLTSSPSLAERIANLKTQ